MTALGAWFESPWATPRQSLWSALRAAASILAPLGALEVLALAPIRQWLWPQVWWAQALGIALVIALVGASAWALACVFARLGWRLSASELAALLSVLIICHAHVRYPLARLLRTGAPVSLFVIGIFGAVVFTGLRRLSTRFDLSIAESKIALVGLLAVALGLTAVRRASIVAADPASRTAVLAGVTLYLSVVLAAIARGGRRRSGWLAATVVVGLVALRLLVPNPHELRVGPSSVAQGRAERSSSANGPPVLLMVLDTLRADALDLGRPPEDSRTPNLARFADEADVYTDAIANASWSLPGHASLFTGLTVAQHRTDETDEAGFGSRLPEAVATAQEIFATSGYRTACAAANTLISRSTGLARGFHTYVAPGAHWIFSAIPLQTLSVYVPNIRQAPLRQLLLDLTGLNVMATAEEIAAYALAQTEGEPDALYLFLNFMDTHDPYPTRPGETLGRRLALLRDYVVLLFAGYDNLDERMPRIGRTLRGRYLAQVQELDRELGRLFDVLRQRGWYDRMLIVVTADHGEAHGENDSSDFYWGHHGAFEPVVRIPLLIKRPGQRQGSVRQRVVQQTDVLPALLELAGLPPRPGLASRVLDPGLELPVLTEWHRRGPNTIFYYPYRRLALYRDRFKLVVEDDGGGDDRRVFLYDLEQSPYETIDVGAGRAALTADLSDELDAALRSAASSRPAATGSSDPEVREQLEALGYVN